MPRKSLVLAAFLLTAVVRSGQSLSCPAGAKKDDLEVEMVEMPSQETPNSRSVNKRDTRDQPVSITPMELPRISIESLKSHEINSNVAKLSKPLPQGDIGKIVPANVLQYPYSAYGRLISWTNTTVAHVCSGAYVSEHVVLTAAHCIYNDTEQRNFWNFTFQQQYHNGSGTERGVKKAFYFKAYVCGTKWERMAYDFAFLAMKDKTSGGYLSMDTPKRYSNWTAAGYPENYANHEVLHKVTGSKRIGILEGTIGQFGNTMGGGCSGGAWFVKNGQKNFSAVGINSFSIGGEGAEIVVPNVMFSPRFERRRTNELLQRAVDEAKRN